MNQAPATGERVVGGHCKLPLYLRLGGGFQGSTLRQGYVRSAEQHRRQRAPQSLSPLDQHLKSAE